MVGGVFYKYLIIDMTKIKAKQTASLRAFLYLCPGTSVQFFNKGYINYTLNIYTKLQACATLKLINACFSSYDFHTPDEIPIPPNPTLGSFIFPIDICEMVSQYSSGSHFPDY